VSAPRAAILLTGNELLRGVIADANGSFLAEQLEALGVPMTRMLVVGDGLAEIERGLLELAGEADLVITSGGLGPTHDDRTVEALARAAEKPLVLDREVLGKISVWTDSVAARMGTDPLLFGPGNEKQAHIPEGASVLGLAGTAPGLVAQLGDAWVVVLPGVPSELRRLFEDVPSHPDLRALFTAAEPRTRFQVRTYGISESRVGDVFRELGGDPPGVETSICARNYEIEIDVRATPGAVEAGRGLAEAMRAGLGEHVFAQDERSLAQIVLDLAGARELTLATAESCTGGLVAGMLTAVPGSSRSFLGGIVSYSNEAKHDLLGVPRELIAEHGAVSPEVAAAMAHGALERLGADLAVAVTGVAGPGGGTPDKPVGLVYLHVAGESGDAARQLDWPGGRAVVRERSAVAALHLLRVQLGTAS